MVNVWLPFQAEVLFTDTDSLTYEIKSKDVYKIKRCFFKHEPLFDFSNYSKFFDQANKKVIAKMKDESEGKIIDSLLD